MMKLGRLSLCTKMLLLGAMGFSCVMAACSAGLPDTDGKGALYGRPAPSFQIKGIYGETYALEQLKGTIMVIQFGTSW